MTVPAKMAPPGEIMESVLMKGDLAKLTPEERTSYYMSLCKSIGLNPLTKPMEYITLNGKLTLYAKRDCADQLRKINGVSLEIVSREIANEILTVHVRAKLPDGRTDEDLGAVAFPDMLKGEARANAELKAVTKAKRRATLSICGLGFLDETEIEDVPASAKRPSKPAPNVMQPHDEVTGEVIDEKPSPAHVPPLAKEPASVIPHPAAEAGTLSEPTLLSFEELAELARSYARAGDKPFKQWYKTLNPSQKGTINSMGDELRGLMSEAGDKIAMNR